MTKIKERIQRLREEMALQKIDAYIVTGTDPHQSEYLADHWNVRKWLSGFTGSAGQLVITLDFAGLWTDSRYFIQAERELADSGIKLVKQIIQYAPEYLQWIKDNLAKESKVVIDGSTISVHSFKDAKKNYLSHVNIVTEDSLLDKIWENRPIIPQSNSYILHEQYTGISAKEKIISLQNWLKDQKLDSIFLTALDDIAWITNLRGCDVSYNPVTIVYMYVSIEKAVLFIDHNKISLEVKDYLEVQHITTLEYQNVFDFLEKIHSSEKIGIDVYQCNQTIADSLKDSYISIANPVPNWKGKKNEIEIKNTKKAMISDGIALTKAFYWLEETLTDRKISEVEFGKILTQYRAEATDYLQDSFGSIVGYNGNGAIIHYSAEEQTCSHIQPEGVLLVDSGGQYLTGTTDITRTIGLGALSDEIKRNFTLVLKGMIGLSQLIFPEGTTGVQMDILARQHLWKNGLSYAHGTGHGVGFCLNVHEGPQGFAGLNSGRSKVPFEEGMITSNEPGYYVDGQYGIRIENLILTKKHPTFEKFLCFETLSLFPIDLNLIDQSLLIKDEVNWLNNYHLSVFELLSPYLDEKHKEWLKKKCEMI
jgi:Xaa-Pro aminopeptidase